MNGVFASTLAFAAGAGLATFAAPCAFPLLPGYVGYALDRGTDGPSGVTAAAAAAVGSLSVLGGVSALAFALGRRVTGLLPIFEPLVGVGLVVFGLLSLSDRRMVSVPLSARPDSAAGFGVFGGAYALAAAGCVVPVFLGVLAQALTFPAPRAAVFLAVYAGATTAPLVGVTLLTSVGVDAWRSLGRYDGLIERFAAGTMILAGVGQLGLAIAVFDVL